MMPLNGCLPCVLMSRIDENTWLDMEPVTQYHAGAIKAISKDWARLIQKTGACPVPDPGKWTR